ncbi:MAG: 2-amino-4-hydroxy-6-hydroxymethyldihydropteridine diphosphokinase [Pseudomonadota bacterium]|jgi:2-amino-4-hydroxy-6-hydroxymethyldihydropteridine pyrophosphokinase|nr:MAG: 2-amino-4-hydroxy-6-hydroxymethyldihydropteridine diphosphokinase [Pseudomonadota bacterium]
MATWFPAYVGIGSNLGEPAARVLEARERLAALPATRLVAMSRLYGSRPFGPVPQPDFVNAVAGLLTQLEPLRLLRELRAIEAEFGRPEQRERWGPRVIDLDLLVYGHERRNEPQLTLPHPGIVERNFVLYPLAEIAPDLDVPGLGRVAELASRVAPDGIWLLQDRTAHS